MNKELTKEQQKTWDALGYDIRYDTNVTRYYLNGVLHRTNGPAVIFSSGLKWWYLHGKFVPLSDFLEKTNKETR